MTGLSIALLSLWFGIAQSAGIRSAAEFSAATGEAKRATLNDLAAFRYSPPPDTVSTLVSSGLADGNAGVRLSAVYAAAGRAGAVRFATVPERRAVGLRERAALARLRPVLIAALSDDDERVRQGAIVALVNLEYQPPADVNDIVIRPDLATAMQLRFDAEPSSRVREEIVKTFALTSLSTTRRDDLLLKALDDEASILSFAVAGLGRSTPSAAMSRIADLLHHDDRSVRLQAAQALAAYGNRARPYIEALAEAASSEKDDAVRNTMEGARSKLLRSQR